MPVGEAVVEAILKLVRVAAARRGGDRDVAEQISWGPGPRASQALMLDGARARPLDGRFAPSLDDVEALAVPCCSTAWRSPSLPAPTASACAT